MFKTYTTLLHMVSDSNAASFLLIILLQGEEEEGEVYEVLNIRSLKQATPNLRVINMWGVSFVDDAHIEAFSSNCIQLAVLCVSYCPKVGLKKILNLISNTIPTGGSVL